MLSVATMKKSPMLKPSMPQQTEPASDELNSMPPDAEHMMPPELPTQDSALEDSVGQLTRVQSKLVDTLHALQLLSPQLVKDHNRAVRAIQEALTLVGDSDDSEAIGPIDWVKFGERLYQRRTAAGLTQEWLAERVGVTATTIRQLEHHTRRARRSLMLKLLAVPELNLRVSDIELSAEMSAGYRHTPTSWLGPTYDPVGMITQLAETMNAQSGQLEQTLVYIDHQSAKDWMATCSSPEYDGEYRDNVPFATMAQRIAALVGDQALTMTALGCGDGRTEAALVKHLQQKLRMPRQTELFLLDVSHSLLNAANRHCCDTLPDIRTYTIHGSFLDMPKMPMLVNPLRGRARLFAMLGYTLVNLSDELRYFRDTLSCCSPGELFLCDISIALAPSHDRQKILKLDPTGSGKLRPSHATWLSGPIRRYCQGAEDVDIRWELAPSGGVPGSYGFDAIARVKMRDGRPDRRFLMWRFRRYDPKLLSDSLAELGWKTIERIDYGPGGKKSLSLLLLQKQ